MSLRGRWVGREEAQRGEGSQFAQLRNVDAHCVVVGRQFRDVEHVLGPREFRNAARIQHLAREVIRILADKRTRDVGQGVEDAPLEVHGNGLVDGEVSYQFLYLSLLIFESPADF